MRTTGSVLVACCLATASWGQVEIPASGRPTPFYDAAGKGVTIEATATPVELTPDESILLTLRVSNLLNAAEVQRPNLAELNAFRVDFQIQDGATTEKEPAGTRIFRYRLRPRSSQVTAIPRFVFPYYDPNLPQPADRPELPFRRARTEPIPIRIVSPVKASQPVVPLEVPAFAENLAARSDRLPAWVILIGIAAPPLLAVLAGVAWWVKNPAGSRLVRHRRSRAARQALKKLRGLDRGAAATPAAAVECVCRYLAEHYDLPHVTHTPAELSELLRKAGAGEATVAECEDFVRASDEARFSPNPLVSTELLIAQAERLVLYQEGEA